MATVTELPAPPPTLSVPTALSGVRVQWLAALTIFCGSFLLFQIQPIIAKQVLPWFGGSAAVWTTCLLFFQATLFLGYVYAHLLLSRLSGRWQLLLSVGLLLASLAALPVIPSAAWKPAGQEDPIPRILGLLAATIGVPYFLLAATSPLVQGLLARKPGAALPYRFYALSNLASLIALLAYPVAIEPLLPARLQSYIWSISYAAFVLLSIACVWQGSRTAVAIPRAERFSATPLRERFLWLALAAMPSVLSLAVTNHLSQNVAAIPFLWILPLSVYLLSLILCFDGDGWYRRPVILPALGVALVGSAWVLIIGTPDRSVRLVIPVFTLLLFVACMFFHGELARRKPNAGRLTGYYLMLSLGGALGAVLVTLGAPYLLSGNYEMHLALAACALFTLLFHYRQHWITDIAWVVVAVTTVIFAWTGMRFMQASAIVSCRDFYGALRVTENSEVRTLVHGAVVHGTEFRDPARRAATTYYAPGSGVAMAIEAFRRPNQKVGVIGLGVGTLAFYGRKGDTYRFYELNPEVARLAARYFSYLSSTTASTSVQFGDGRLTLEREPANGFDVLVVDAFSGDSIPVHLLSREALRVYFRHLAPDGVLALHVTNSVLNLIPVAARLAVDAGRTPLHIHALSDARIGRSDSDWVLVAAKEVLAARPALVAAGSIPDVAASFPVWTDDYSNLFRVLK